MTDQTPAEPHPLAFIGAMADAIRLDEAVTTSFERLAADAGDINIRERLAALPSTTVTLEGTFTGSAGLEAFMPSGPVLRDMAFVPDAEDRKPCPHCGVLAEEIDYFGCVIPSMDTERDGALTTFSVHVSRYATALLKPCGHRFDGATDDLIEDTP